MNEHEQEFHELIKQLGAERPLAPEPNQAFTAGLRGRLLGRYDQNIGQDIGRLASTATALAVLALVVFIGWFHSSSQQQQTIAGDAIQTTRLAETTDSTSFERISFEKDFQLVGFTFLPNPPESDSGTMKFAVDWRSANRITDDSFSSYGGWVHIVNEQGELVAEVFGGLEWQPIDEGSLARMEWTERERLPNGRYSIYAAIYDQTTRKNLLSATGDEFVLVDTIVIEDTAIVAEEQLPTPSHDILFSTADDVPFAAPDSIAFGDNVALTYRHYILEDPSGLTNGTHTLRLYWEARQEPEESLSTFVHILDETGQLVQQQDEPLLWTVASGRLARPSFEVYALQSVRVDVPDGRYQVKTGLYDNTSGERWPPMGEDTSIWLDELVIGDDFQTEWQIRPLTVTQLGRSTAIDPIEFELTLGYEAATLPQGLQARLRFVNPQWLSGLGEAYEPMGKSVLPLTASSNTITFHVILNAQAIQQTTGSNIFMAVIDIFTTSESRQMIIRETILLSDLPMMVNDVSQRLYYEEINGEIVNTFFD